MHTPANKNTIILEGSLEDQFSTFLQFDYTLGGQHTSTAIGGNSTFEIEIDRENTRARWLNLKSTTDVIKFEWSDTIYDFRTGESLSTSLSLDYQIEVWNDETSQWEGNISLW